MNYTMLHGKDKYALLSHEKNVVLAYEGLKKLKDARKIVIIAGSNGAFGFNSRMLSDTLHLPVVNTATHAGIGIRMQFEIYKEFLHKGDVVILCPEYKNVGEGKQRMYGDATLLRVLSTHLPSAYTKISFCQWLSVYKYIGVYYAERKEHAGITEFDGPYSASAINEYGDIDCKRLHQDTIKQHNIDGRVNEDLLCYLKYIHSYAREKGISLCFFPPTLMKSTLERNQKQIDSIYHSLIQNGIAFQATPLSYSFADSFYFDSPYHLTQSGANLRTREILKDLHRILNVRE